MELLSVRGIRKYFPETDTLANDGVSLAIKTGELRAVVGENGAGKSTLAKIVGGLLRPDSGELLVRGRTIRFGSVREAEAAGIGFVPQQSLLAPGLTVAENLVLGHEPRLGGLFLDRRRAYVDAALLVERFGFKLNPELRVNELSPAERRQAEIARALARGGELLVLDEPTSILAESESESLFALLKRLAEDGKGILFITHRLAEVLSAATSITVLREGRVVADMPTSGCDEGELSRLMKRDGHSGRAGAGAAVRAAAPERGALLPVEPGSPPALEARAIVLRPGAAPLSFALGAGEVLGVVALAGNGLNPLEDALSGLRRPRRGRVLIGGEDLYAIRAEELRSRRLAYVPSDRESRGLCLQASLRDNLLVLKRRDFSAREWLFSRRRSEVAAGMAVALNLAADLRARAASLSGGNRQRLLLSRELEGARSVAVLAEPLQSLDLEAQAEASRQIREWAAAGAAIVLLSSSLEEVFPLADRIAVLYRGSLVHEGKNEGPASAHFLLALMTGLRTGGSAA